MRNSTLLCRRDFLGIALRLDILTKIFNRIFNQNLSMYSVCSVDPLSMLKSKYFDHYF